MNDFTKEELTCIFNHLRDAREWSDDLISSWPLLNKIQAMIDACCERAPFNPDCYCGQVAADGAIIAECGYPPHKKEPSL